MKKLTIRTLGHFGGCLLWGCSNSKKIEPQRYLALGDSYTIGESVSATNAGLYNWQTPCLPWNSVSSPQIIARTGWTTDELQTALESSALNPPYDWVSLLIGVNNQYRGRTVSSFEPEFQALLEQAIEWWKSSERVFVVSIPDWGAMPLQPAGIGPKLHKVMLTIKRPNGYVKTLMCIGSISP